MTTSNVLTRRRLQTRVATVQQHDGHSMEWQHVRIKKITSGGPDNVFLSSTYFTEGRTDLPGEAICLEGSAPYFPRKYKATYDFPGRGADPLSGLWIRPWAVSWSGRASRTTRGLTMYLMVGVVSGLPGALYSICCLGVSTILDSENIVTMWPTYTLS